MSVDALRAVRERIASGWSQGADARDSLGREVALASSDASAWSLAAAFSLAGKDGIPLNHLPGALRALAAVTEIDSLTVWNDETGRTKQEVLDALDDAIQRVEGTDHVV